MSNRRKPVSIRLTKSRKAKSSRKLERIDAEALAAEQGVQPISNPQELYADFWPEDETADQFNQAVRQWRQQSKGNHF